MCRENEKANQVIPCVAFCRTHNSELQHITSEETSMLHVLFIIAVLPLCLYLAFVALLAFVAKLMK